MVMGACVSRVIADTKQKLKGEQDDLRRGRGVLTRFSHGKLLEISEEKNTPLSCIYGSGKGVG